MRKRLQETADAAACRNSQNASDTDGFSETCCSSDRIVQQAEVKIKSRTLPEVWRAERSGAARVKPRTVVKLRFGEDERGSRSAEGNSA